MSIFSADFDELYRRHLCRHSQFGLNVLHVLAVLGIYFGLCQLVLDAAAFAGIEHPASVVGLLMIPYLALLARNLPAAVWIATATAVSAIVAVSLAMPILPWWLSLLVILSLHQSQRISHRFYPLERDMSGFRQKYVKGPRLFVLLAIYELPILLNYLLFGASDWVCGGRQSPSNEPGA